MKKCPICDNKITTKQKNAIFCSAYCRHLFHDIKNSIIKKKIYYNIFHFMIAQEKNNPVFLDSKNRSVDNLKYYGLIKEVESGYFIVSERAKSVFRNELSNL